MEPFTDESVVDALVEDAKAAEQLAQLEASGVSNGLTLEAARARKTVAEEKIRRLIVNKRDGVAIASLISGLTALAKSKPRRRAKVVHMDDTPFRVLLGGECTQVAGTGGLDPVGPSISASFDLKRSFITRFGYAEARKLPDVVIERINEFVRVFSDKGFFQISELRHTIETTSGIARAKTVLINGLAEDVEFPPKKAWPKFVRVFDIAIDESS